MTSASKGNWKEPSSSTVLTDSAFNGDNNEETRKVVLRKILEKVFINKKFTQCKTSRTLKIDLFEIPDKKNIGKLFAKYELLFFNQANFCSDPSQIFMLQFPTPVASLSPLPSMSSFTLANWNGTSTQYLSCSSSVSLLFPTPFDHTLAQVLDMSNYMPSEANHMHYQAIYRS